jgi:hypothetical protein
VSLSTPVVSHRNVEALKTNCANGAQPPEPPDTLLDTGLSDLDILTLALTHLTQALVTVGEIARFHIIEAQILITELRNREAVFALEYA